MEILSLSSIEASYSNCVSQYTSFNDSIAFEIHFQRTLRTPYIIKTLFSVLLSLLYWLRELKLLFLTVVFPRCRIIFKYSKLYYCIVDENIKTSFVLPKNIYLELKRRALEEGRTVRELLIEAIVEYLAKPKRESARRRLIELVTTPSPGAGPEDYREYEYEDIGR
ncbi:MAG: hypothetical protein DRN53_05275 [Thermoprotei archaeon]|nr:MAG: hypothetical protein DRN53_05275 [Thermoprotei archaeon]